MSKIILRLDVGLSFYIQFSGSMIHNNGKEQNGFHFTICFVSPRINFCCILIPVRGRWRSKLRSYLSLICPLPGMMDNSQHSNSHVV